MTEWSNPTVAKIAIERLQEERDSALARADQAEAREVELRGACYRVGMSIHEALCEGGGHAPACQEIADALSSPCPVAQAMARVVEAVGVEYESPHLKSELCEKCEVDEVLAITLESHESTMEAYAVYLDTNSGPRAGKGELRP